MRVIIGLAGRNVQSVIAQFVIEDLQSDWGEALLVQWLRDAISFDAALVIINDAERPIQERRRSFLIP